MSPRAARLLALTVAAAVAAIALAGLTGAGVAVGSSTHHRLVLRCQRLLLGVGSGAARPVPGSADPQVAAELSIFRVTRTSEDALPSARSVGRALRSARVATYDPSASVRLSVAGSQSATVYAVPATLATPHVPAACLHLRGAAIQRAGLALRTQETGTGPGVCLISVQVEPTGPPISVLPGQRRRGPTGTATVADAGCESLTVMASYLGTFAGGVSTVGLRAALVPDGVSSLSYTFADGRQVSAPVSGNLALVPQRDTYRVGPGKVTRARLTREFTAGAPTSVAETDATGALVATYTRPPWLIPELVTVGLAFRRSLQTSAQSGSIGSRDAYAACRAQTHRCVAAVVSTKCSVRRERCTIARRVARYRYVGRRPPPGTTGKANIPTAPIRGRASGYFTHPQKVTLALSGAPHHRVDVLVAATCFFRRGSGGARGVGRQPLQLAVPSRTTIARVPRGRRCDVNVLVMSAQPRSIGVSLARG